MFLYGGTKEFEIINTVMAESDSTPISSAVNSIVETCEQLGFSGNLWQNYITYAIVMNDNAFSRRSEGRGLVDGSIVKLALDDFSYLMEAFNYNLACKNIDFLKDYEAAGECDNEEIIKLSRNLSRADSLEAFMQYICDFYKDYGVGQFAMHRAFRIEKHADKVSVVPITSVDDVMLDSLVGYEIQKKKLVDNTEAFLAGKMANNVLLFGDSGTGKSTSIKAILNEYGSQGLRMIEIYKHQFDCLFDVIHQIKDRNYKFIIYMDDLSFEDFEIEYKYLKAIIEGGLETRPQNVLIYATSNRRHLVREKFSDKEERDDDLHTRDTVQEKLSLSARFGVSIYYGSPDKKEYNNIVKTLAARNNIDIDEDTLALEAGKWELSHGGLSGRTASQFIAYISGIYRSDK